MKTKMQTSSVVGLFLGTVTKLPITTRCLSFLESIRAWSSHAVIAVELSQDYKCIKLCRKIIIVYLSLRMLCMCAAVQRRHKESMQNTANAFFVLFQAHLKKWIEVITTGSTQTQQVAAKTSHSSEEVSQFTRSEIENSRVRCSSMNPLLKWVIESAMFFYLLSLEKKIRRYYQSN